MKAPACLLLILALFAILLASPVLATLHRIDKALTVATERR